MGSEGSRREIEMMRVTHVTRFKVHPLALDAKTNHHALACSCTLCSLAACFGWLWSQTVYCLSLPSATSVQETRCPSAIYSVHISGKTVLKRSAKKRSILQVFRSFRTGTTDTDAAPACVLNIVANIGTGCIQKRTTWNGRGTVSTVHIPLLPG